MGSARLIICEKTGRWAFALRGLVTLPQAELCETRSLPETQALLQTNAAGLLAVECTAENWHRVCQWLARTTGQFAATRVVVLADPSLRGAECLLRTSGAHHVVYSLLGLLDASRWIARHFRQLPQHEQPDREWTWDRLPWSAR